MSAFSFLTTLLAPPFVGRSGDACNPGGLTSGFIEGLWLWNGLSADEPALFDMQRRFVNTAVCLASVQRDHWSIPIDFTVALLKVEETLRVAALTNLQRQPLRKGPRQRYCAGMSALA